MVNPASQGRKLPSDSRRYASVYDAAEYLACKHKFIRGLINAGTLHGYRLPGSRAIRVDLNELDALMGGDAA